MIFLQKFIDIFEIVNFAKKNNKIKLKKRNIFSKRNNKMTKMARIFITVITTLAVIPVARANTCLLTGQGPRKASPSLVQCYRDNTSTCCNSLTDNYIKEQYSALFTDSCARNYPVIVFINIEGSRNLLLLFLLATPASILRRKYRDDIDLQKLRPKNLGRGQ